METRYSKRGIVILCSAVYFVSYFSRKDFAAVMAAMLETGVLDKGTAGLIGTMLFVFYGVGQLLSGYLGDRVRPRHLLALGMLVTALCNLVFPLVSLPVLRILLWGVNGLAQAMLWPPIVRILATHLTSEDVMNFNPIQSSNAFSWIFSSVDGSLISVIAVHPENASAPISVSPSPKLTSANPSQP